MIKYSRWNLRKMLVIDIMFSFFKLSLLFHLKTTQGSASWHKSRTALRMCVFCWQFNSISIQNHCYEIYLCLSKCNIALIYLYATFYTGVIISQCFMPIIWKEKVDYQFTMFETLNWVTSLHPFVQRIYLSTAFNVYGSSRFNFDLLPVGEKTF